MAENNQKYSSQHISTETTSNKRIAKNAMFLYFRMFITLIVGLYTGRVVLDILGVEDYGVYGVVGTVLGMLGFLNTTMSGATSRFLNFAMGKGNKDEVAKTFSSALIIHMGIALIIFVLAETVGLWFLNNKLVIPDERMFAARYIYQLSIASAMLGITQAPYGAIIISNEKMDIFAYFTLLNVFLKLGIVFLLTLGDFDKLIFYGWLTFSITVLMRVLYRVYCVRHFEEAKFHWIWEKDRLKELLSFSVLNLFGNFGSILNHQGTTIVINRFFGVAMNAAASIGLTIANTVNLFAANLMTAFRPQIVQTYSKGDYARFQELTIMAIKIILLVYSLVAIPTFIQADYILDLWLVKPPAHSSLFCRIMLISIFFETLRFILIINIHAVGKVKFVSLTTGILLSLTPFITYFMFCMGAIAEFAFVTFVIVHFTLSAIDLYLVHRYIPQVSMKLYCISILQIIAIPAIVLVSCTYLTNFLGNGITNLIFCTILSSILLIGLSFTLCLNKPQRQYTIQLIKSKIHLK